MSYVVSSLPAYTRQDANKLIYEKLFNVIPTLQYCNEQTNIKSAETIDLLSSQAFWATQSCSFSASGADTFSQRTLTVGKIQVQKKWCERDLEPKYLQEKMKKGGNYTSLTYNTQIIDNTLQTIQKDFEHALWMGQIGSGTHNLGHFDGFKTIVDAISDIGTRTYSGTTYNEANARTAFKGLADLITQNTDVFRGGDTAIKFFCSPRTAQTYRWKLASDNVGFAGAWQAENKGKTFIEGTNIELVEVPGLSSAAFGTVYAIEPENMYFGTDMANEAEKFEVWFSQDNREIRMHSEFKAGVQVAFTGRVFRYLGV